MNAPLESSRRGGAIVLAVALAVGCSAAKPRMESLLSGMTKNDVVERLGSPAAVIGSVRDGRGRTLEVWEYPLTFASLESSSEQTEDYWLYFSDGQLTEWREAGDWRSERTRIVLTASLGNLRTGMGPGGDRSRLMLTADDLPTGFVRAREYDIDTNNVAQAWGLHGDRTRWATTIASWGLAHGYGIAFQRQPQGATPGTVVDTIVSELAVFATDENAAVAFAGVRKANQDIETIRSLVQKAGGQLRVFNRVVHPPIADESFTTHSRVAVPPPGESFADTIVVTWRRGSAIARVTWTAIDADVVNNEAVGLALTQDRRLVHVVEMASLD